MIVKKLLLKRVQDVENKFLSLFKIVKFLARIIKEVRKEIIVNYIIYKK